ncbi:MAG: hypothetical protein ACSHYF_11545 [Verrucomicrobiaceae bacterium]
MKSFIPAGIAAFTLALLPAQAQDEELPDHKLSEWTLGEAIIGEGVDLDALKGRVVVIEKWGTR